MKTLQYLDNFSHDDLHFVGVKINDVKVSKLVTYFDFFDFNVTNSVFYSQEELQSYPTGYVIRQPRLNHEPFTVTVDIKSDVANDAVFKVFLGPKYNHEGYPVNIEEDWMKFYELDWFAQRLVPGDNKVVRKSSEFLFFKEDSVPIAEIHKWLDQGKVPYDMSVMPNVMPRRLMLPKGVPGGYPFQIFVVVYPYTGFTKYEESMGNYVTENRSYGFPLDRPVREVYFRQPNMFFEDVKIYHKDEFLPYQLNVPSYFTQKKA